MISNSDSVSDINLLLRSYSSTQTELRKGLMVSFKDIQETKTNFSDILENFNNSKNNELIKNVLIICIENLTAGAVILPFIYMVKFS